MLAAERTPVTGARSPFLPHLARIAAVRDETADVRTLRLELLDDPEGAFRWRAGQFAEYSVFGAGEAVFTLANAPSRGPHVECTLRAVGNVTQAVHALSVGQVMGVRGPYGNSFPVEDWRGKDLVFVAGGIGMAALRAPLQHVLDHRDEFGQVVLLNGARSVGDLVYKEEMREWAAAPRTRVVRTVDPGGERPGWDGEVGLLPQVFERLALPPQDRVVVVCGPPIMLRFMFEALTRGGYDPAQVVTTLENKMKCGLGLCGRCNVGRLYVCKDGPVFTWAAMRELPADF